MVWIAKPKLKTRYDQFRISYNITKRNKKCIDGHRVAQNKIKENYFILKIVGRGRWWSLGWIRQHYMQ